MFNGGSGFSLADIAAACRGNGNNGDGFGGNNGWWVIIILLALWSNNGNGLFGRNNGNNGNCCCNGGGTTYVPVPMGGYGMYGSAVGFSDAAMQRGFDNQTVINKLDGISNGICSLGYDQLNRFNGIDQNVMQMGFGLQNAYQQGQINNMQSFNALSTQLGGCCCDIKSALGDLKYDMAASDCSIKTLINQVAQQSMWAQQTNTRDLMDLINNKFCQLEMSQKDDVIAELRAQLATCGNRSDLQALYQQFVAFYNQQNPRPMPAYPAANPNGMGNWSSNVIAQGGDGCNCFNNNCCRC